MVTRIACVGMLLVMFTMPALASFPPDQVEDARKRILDWSTSLKNFSCRYHVEGMVLRSNEHRRANFDYRLSEGGSDFYFKMEDLAGSDLGRVTIFASSGVYRQMLDIHPLYDAHGVVNLEGVHIPFPWGVYITPQELFGYMGWDISLAQVLENGDSLLTQKDDMLVFSHRNCDIGRAVDIYLNSNLDVTKIERVIRPCDTFNDAIEKMWKEDPLSFRGLQSTLEFDAFSEVNGVRFPISGRKVWWDVDTEENSKLNQMVANGLMDEATFYVELFSLPDWEGAHQNFFIETVDVNMPMTEGDFLIDWPKGTKITDKATGKVTNTAASFGENLPSISRITAPVFFGVLAFFLAIAAVAAKGISMYRRG